MHRGCRSCGRIREKSGARPGRRQVASACHGPEPSGAVPDAERTPPSAPPSPSRSERHECRTGQAAVVQRDSVAQIVQSIERGIERWHARNEVGARTAPANGAGTGSGCSRIPRRAYTRSSGARTGAGSRGRSSTAIGGAQSGRRTSSPPGSPGRSRTASPSRSRSPWNGGSQGERIPAGNHASPTRAARSAFSAVGLDTTGPCCESGKNGPEWRDSQGRSDCLLSGFKGCPGLTFNQPAQQKPPFRSLGRLESHTSPFLVPSEL